MNSLFSAISSMPLLMGGMGGAPAGDAASGASSFMSFLPLVAIVAIFYFLILRPQNKKQKETRKMLDALKKGDRVVTIGGIHGVIQSVKETTVIIKVDENTKLEFNRGAISGVESQAKDDKEEKKTEASEEKGGNTSEAEGKKD